MYLFSLLLFALFFLFTSTTQAIPVRRTACARDDGWCCIPNLPLGQLAGTPITVPTPLGLATGVFTSSGMIQFAVRYASAARWRHPVVASRWQLPNNATDPATLPYACPQPPTVENSASTSEDCLSLLLYVPVPQLSSPEGAMSRPALMWIHGGSFVVGSATGPNVDGAALANATGAVVAIIQYRLGAFGFLSPSGESNLAVRDAIAALNFLHTILPSFYSNPSRITIAGQSSGATMVRSLLAAPSASSLFNNAIIQSDPMDIGFLSTDAFNTLNNFFMTQIHCPASDNTCLNNLVTDDVLYAGLKVFGAASSLDPSAGNFEPLRTVVDENLITNALDATAAFPSQSKPILVTTVTNEAGKAIYGTFPSPVPANQLSVIMNASLGSSRTGSILGSSFYSFPQTNNSSTRNSSTTGSDARSQLEQMGTDQIWRCPSWTFSRLWAAAGGTTYVGEFALGVPHPDNAMIPFCTSKTAVCHEDDIGIVFGNAGTGTSNNGTVSLSPTQVTLVRQLQARYAAFLNNGNPNVNGLAEWLAVKGNTTNALTLGDANNGVAVAVGACTPGFWGGSVPFDYQLFTQ